MKPTRVLMAGGGTGGHIYPAIAIARYFQKSLPGSRVEFVGSHRGLEKEIVPKAGFKLHKISVGQLHSSVGRFKQIKTLLLMPFVFLQALWILIRFRPKYVIGVGGYASGPMVLVASLCGVKTAIWEANIQPGMTNKYLSRFVNHCFVVFEQSLDFFPKRKGLCVGYPVREDFEVAYDKKIKAYESNPKPQVQPSRLKVLAFGGSQGAAIFNDIIPEVSVQLPEVDFVLQTGLKNFEKMQEQHSHPENLKLLAFLDPILDYLKSADLVIARSGAGAIAELSALGLNCLFVPFARASDGHQQKNAQALVAMGGADLILEKDLNPESLKTFLTSYINKSPEQKLDMQKKILVFFRPGACEAIFKALTKS